MAISMLSKTGEELYYFDQNVDRLTLDEQLNNTSNNINKLLDEVVPSKNDSVHLSNEIMQYSVGCEQKGFRNGFAAGMKFIMQAMVKE